MNNQMINQYLQNSQRNITQLIQLMLIQERNCSRLISRRDMSEVNQFNNLHNLLFTIPTEPVETNNLTRTELNQVIITQRYNLINNPLNSTCPITRDEFRSTDQVIMICSCRHLFTSGEHIISWLRVNPICPLCRHSLRDDLPQSTRDNLNTYQAPAQAPFRAPFQSPFQSPFQAPFQTPFQAPVQAPAQAPAQAPVQAPAQAQLPNPLNRYTSPQFSTMWGNLQTTIEQLALDPSGNPVSINISIDDYDISNTDISNTDISN